MPRWRMMFNRPDMVWGSAPAKSSQDHFAGKLILIVDAGCMLACEDFTMPFKDKQRATLVRETTAGSSGQPYMLDLGKGMMIMIGAKREIFPDGSRFEGVGIKPDVEAVPSPADWKQGRNTVLEAACKQGAL
jgi:carboxyl-terminal processing protease